MLSHNNQFIAILCLSAKRYLTTPKNIPPFRPYFYVKASFSPVAKLIKTTVEPENGPPFFEKGLGFAKFQLLSFIYSILSIIFLSIFFSPIEEKRQEDYPPPFRPNLAFLITFSHEIYLKDTTTVSKNGPPPYSAIPNRDDKLSHYFNLFIIYAKLWQLATGDWHPTLCALHFALCAYNNGVSPEIPNS